MEYTESRFNQPSQFKAGYHQNKTSVLGVLIVSELKNQYMMAVGNKIYQHVNSLKLMWVMCTCSLF